MTRIRGLSEGDKTVWNKHFVVLVTVFVAATVVSGVGLQEVYAHTKDLKPIYRGLEVPILLSVLDLITCCVLVTWDSKQSLKMLAEGIIVCLLSHVGSIYMLNTWFTFNRKSYMIGYLEPVVMVTLLKICAGRDISVRFLSTLVFVSVFAVMTSGGFLTFLKVNRNGILLFLYIFFLCLRNIVIKHLYDESFTLKLRKSLVIPYTATLLTIAIILSAFHLTYWALPVMFAIIAMFAQVTVFYCTTLLLQQCHMTSIAVISVWAQILMNLVCMASLYVHYLSVSLLAVVALIGATYLYHSYVNELDSVQSHSHAINNKVPKDEMYTRIEFLLFVGSVMGLIFYVFQPSISERDLNNLHFSGLDVVLKRLLNHET